MAIRTLIRRWFDIHEEEIGLFLWSLILLFLVRSSGILLNNYAETTFLKRYGVEYMPIVTMINAVMTFFLMGLMTGFMTRVPGARLLSRLFVFCGLSVAGLRAIIPLGIDLIYPALFMLKSQYEVLLALLFWNLANDLFNTRQSKRLFPLITAGGVVGQILGSFATPVVARWFHLDNLLIVYVATAFSGAWAVHAMGRRFPTLLFQQEKGGEEKKKTNMVEEIKTLLPLIRSSLLFKILVVLTFMPNVVIPIMNYQFNFAVNEQFATESGLIAFFGYFRGVLNIVSLVILLFVGKLYDRFGLSVALMFHPFNYLLVFLTFLFRFDAVAAMYARMSSNIIRTTINIPATAVVTGLFPDSYRALVRPFLRGTVVRIGLFLGSGLILISENLFHPRYLSLVAMPFVLAWLIMPFVLKRRYADILLDLIEDDRIDFRLLDEAQLEQVFRDKAVQDRLLQRFMAEFGENRLWYARFLQSIAFPGLDTHLLKAIGEETDNSVRLGLVRLLSDQAGQEAMAVFGRWIQEAESDLAVAMIDAGHRMSPTLFAPMNRQIFESKMPLAVRAHAAGALFAVDPERFGPIIEGWLSAGDKQTRHAGILAAGVCRDKRFETPLQGLLSADDHTQLLALESLHALGATGLNDLVVHRLDDADPRMRHDALEVFSIRDETDLKKVISLLGDRSNAVRELAREKIRSAEYQNSQRLIKSLSLPRKRVRESLYELLSDMSIKDLDVFRFVASQARACYLLIIQADAVKILADSGICRLLETHLQERVWFTLQTTIRVLAVQDRSGRMNTVAKGLFSSDKRQRANSLEAMDDILDKGTFRLLVPLLDDSSPVDQIQAGQLRFPNELKIPTPSEVIDGLLKSRSWVSLVLTLAIIEDGTVTPPPIERIDELVGHENVYVSQTAKRLQRRLTQRSLSQEQDMKTEPTIALTDKILYLRKIEIFSDLSINELAAIASVTEEVVYEELETVFHEGEKGDTLFLIVEGDVSVLKDLKGDNPFELDRIGAGDYFGEMALFGDDRRSATIQVRESARFLTLEKQEFQEIVREFPQIALHVCRVLTMRIRHLHGKLSEHTC